MCELLNAATIEKSFDTEVKGGAGRQRGKQPLFLSTECRYETDGFPSLATELITTRPGKSDQEVLDGVFADRAAEDAAVGEYEQVPGLGTLAGFGRNATMGGAGLNAWDLGVVHTAGGERLLLTVAVVGKAELDQVRPLAQELLANLDAAVRGR